jgi:hypothetical protein
MTKAVLSLAILFVLALSVSCMQTKPKAFSCLDHDWRSVQDMVFPYIEDDMQTAMIMQGQSSNYKISMAADFALAFEESYPDSLTLLLKNIGKCN